MTPDISPITIRRATEDDDKALDRLARLDSRRLPAGPHLLALADDVPVAAISLSSGLTVANPFATTDSVVALLHERAEHLLGRPPAAPPARHRGLRPLQAMRGLFPVAPRARPSRSS
ncbi:MAG TPA: hypothetical protein VFG42_00510 [Baekduia sp.]|uniref:hypothetical protein n=1 Tax=Baekduia sp. TaxID=2600305 RepID=UPI002D78DBC7|nr:hypothetical protein [Baekduia sp.]HET6505241.1 hypothetical protein [Baekduia sp.]